MSELDYLDDDIQGFDPAEVDGVIANYVCAVCHSTLVSFQIPNERKSIIACLEHGNVEHCGRVMKSSVSIELERGYLDYKEVVQNLSDLWGDLIEHGYKVNKPTALRIMHDCVCKKCGKGLSISRSTEDGYWEINCRDCGNVDEFGYTKKGEYHVSDKR